MPDARTHRGVATLAGVGVGLYAVRNVSTLDAALARILGSVLAANLAAMVPDVLEPAVHSRHRKVFHSVAALAGTARVSLRPPQRARLGEREAEAVRLKAHRAALAPQDPDRLWLWLAEMLQHLFIGAAMGAPVGYLSHLVLDAGSPRGLPPV